MNTKSTSSQIKPGCSRKGTAKSATLLRRRAGSGNPTEGRCAGPEQFCLSGEHDRAVARAFERKTAVGRRHALRRIELGERVHALRAHGVDDHAIARTLAINGSTEPQALRRRLNRLEQAAGLTPVPIDDKARQAVATAKRELLAARTGMQESRAKLGLGPDLFADDVLNAQCRSLSAVGAELRYWKCLRQLREKALARTVQ